MKLYTSELIEDKKRAQVEMRFMDDDFAEACIGKDPSRLTLNLSIICESRNLSTNSDSIEGDLEARHFEQYLERALEYVNGINKTLDPEWTGWRIKSFHLESEEAHL